MADFLRCGMSMRTPKGSVDMVPLFRRLEGDMNTPVSSDERTAAVLALTHLGTSIDQIAKAMHMAHRDIRAVLLKNGMQPIGAPESIAWTSVVHTRSNTERRERRRAERVIVDGLLVHPDAPHGTDTGYTEYCCHCTPCNAAHTAKLAEHRAKRARAA